MYWTSSMHLGPPFHLGLGQKRPFWVRMSFSHKILKMFVFKASKIIAAPRRLATLCLLRSASGLSGPVDGFAKFSTGLMRGNQKMFDRIASDLSDRQLPAGGRVLDIGASAGEPSLTVASRLPHLSKVVSTDFAPPNLAIGTARAESFGLSDRVEFHTTDAQDLSAWDDNSFDAVVGTYVLMFTPDVPQVCREVRRVLKPGAPFVTAVWQTPDKIDFFGRGLMKMVLTLREAGSLPMPDPNGPPPTNPCNLADSAPEGSLGNALRAAGFDDVKAEEWAYPIVCAGQDPKDVARRFIEATPFHGEIYEAGGEELLSEAYDVMAKVFEDAGHEMVDLKEYVPEWTGVDNPDSLTRGMLFKENTCLYVSAV